MTNVAHWKRPAPSIITYMLPTTRLFVAILSLLSSPLLSSLLALNEQSAVPVETKQNGTKRNETKRNETKPRYDT